MSEAADQIAADAMKPQSVSNDGVTIVRRPSADSIAADRYKRDVAATASSNANLGFRINQIVPSGGPR